MLCQLHLNKKRKSNEGKCKKIVLKIIWGYSNNQIVEILWYSRIPDM